MTRIEQLARAQRLALIRRRAEELRSLRKIRRQPTPAEFAEPITPLDDDRLKDEPLNRYRECMHDDE